MSVASANEWARRVSAPHVMTWLRIVAAIPIILLIADGSPAALWSALLIMILAEGSDWADGFLARRLNLVSSVGKILDPLADSLYRIAVFIAFVHAGWMPTWMLLVVIWRDVIVSHLRLVSEQMIGTMAARQSGKLKALAQAAAQLILIFAHAVYADKMPDFAGMAATTSLYIATLVTMYSLIDYAASVVNGLTHRKTR